MTDTYLTSTRDGAVERLTLNRPDVRNAFNEHVIAELTDWAAGTREAATRHDIRAVVIAGAGARLSAARAREIGLVHEIAAAADLDAAVDRFVREVLSAGPEAVAAAKALIPNVWGRPIAEAMPITAAAIAARRVSAEGQEGL